MNKNYIFVTKNEYARNVTYLGFETFELYQYLYCVTLQYLTRNKHMTFIYFLHKNLNDECLRSKNRFGS